MGNLPFFPAQASTIAPQVDLLLLVLMGLSGFFTAIVVIMIVFFAVRYRRGRQVDRSDPPTTSMKVELSWVFGLLILGMGTYTWAAIMYFNMLGQPQNDPLDVYVVGLQWMWKFQHPNGPSEINELHVPVGREVRLIMISQDVIHSFFVPAFRVKYDVLPGRYTNLWFEPTQTGEFDIFCTEYCGTLHSRMIGRVIVMEPQEYQQWLGSGGSTASGVQAGEGLFTQLGCSGCHQPGSNVTAPDLTGIFDQPRQMESGEVVTADEAYIRESILNPQERIVAGFDPIMPTYEGRISEEQLLQLITYIRSLGAGNAPGGETTPGGGAAPGGESGTGAGGATDPESTGTPRTEP